MTAASMPKEAIDVMATAHQKREAQRIVDEAQAMMREHLNRGILLGGRTWLPIRTVTFELERLRVDVIRRAGIAGLFPDLRRGGDPDALSALVLTTAFAHGALFDLLAHLLVEEGVEYLPWSKALAADRAQFFASLAAPEDHQTIESTILLLVLDFFLKASVSMPISLKSLVVDGIREMESARSEAQRSRLPNTPRAADNSSSAGTTTSDAGTPLSEPSLGSGASTS